MQLKYNWDFLPSRNWGNFPFVTILDQSQMETVRHFMTILCLYCIAELHIYIQFSTIVAFPVIVPISSLIFFCVTFKFTSILFSPVLPHELLRTKKFAPSFHWDLVPSPP